MKRFFVAVIILCSSLAEAGAAETYAVCDNCSEARYRETAIAVVPSNPGRPRYEVYVADISKGILRRFRVTVVNEPGLVLHHARSVSPEEAEMQRFEAFISARNEILQALNILDFTIVIPPGHFVGSAYDLWASHHNQLLVREFINAELSVLETAFSNLFAFGSFLLDRSSSRLFVNVVFPDGSLAIFELTGKREDLVWEYLAGQSIDQDGNLIPDSLPDFAEYSGLFNSVSVEQFLTRAMSYGIPIVDERNGNEPVAVVCIHSANGDYSCVATTTH